MNIKKIIILILAWLFIFGCALINPKPNISVLYYIPEISAKLPSLDNSSIDFKSKPIAKPAKILFQKLYKSDSRIALEVGKIPEFQGEIGETQILALKRFVYLIEKATIKEKANINKLLQVGKPEFRRYCTPVQAIFWLLEKKDYQYQNILMKPLEDILSQAWNFCQKNRWSNFKMVTDRLNAPELIVYYSKVNFSYVSYGQRNITARYIFFSKKGCCQDYTAFDIFCLKNAGYDAKPIIVKSSTGNSKGHIVCEYKAKDGKDHIMDNSCGFCTNGKAIEEKKIYIKRLPQIGIGYSLK